MSCGSHTNDTDLAVSYRIPMQTRFLLNTGQVSASTQSSCCSQNNGTSAQATRAIDTNSNYPCYRNSDGTQTCYDKTTNRFFKPNSNGNNTNSSNSYSY